VTSAAAQARAGPPRSRYDGAVRISFAIMARRIRQGASLAVLLSALAGCHGRAPAGRYEKDGVAFDHLAGWSVTGDIQKNARTIVVEGPEHAVMAFSVFAPSQEVSLDGYIQAATKSRAAGVERRLGIAGGAVADTTAPARTTRAILGANVAGFDQHFTIDLLNAHVPHTVEYFLTAIGTRAVIFMDQVPDAHRSKVDAGFQKIFDTLTVTR